jgi:hypothetical protein
MNIKNKRKHSLLARTKRKSLVEECNYMKIQNLKIQQIALIRMASCKQEVEKIINEYKE